MLRRLLREGVDLRLEHGSDLWPVRADETQISNALINLVINARDAMPKGGTVTIATENETVHHAVSLGTGTMPPGDYVRIDVRDTGIGISHEHIEKILRDAHEQRQQTVEIPPRLAQERQPLR